MEPLAGLTKSTFMRLNSLAEKLRVAVDHDTRYMEGAACFAPLFTANFHGILELMRSPDLSPADREAMGAALADHYENNVFCNPEFPGGLESEYYHQHKAAVHGVGDADIDALRSWNRKQYEKQLKWPEFGALLKGQVWLLDCLDTASREIAKRHVGGLPQLFLGRHRSVVEHAKGVLENHTAAMRDSKDQVEYEKNSAAARQAVLKMLPSQITAQNLMDFANKHIADRAEQLEF